MPCIVDLSPSSAFNWSLICCCMDMDTVPYCDAGLAFTQVFFPRMCTVMERCFRQKYRLSSLSNANLLINVYFNRSLNRSFTRICGKIRFLIPSFARFSFSKSILHSNLRESQDFWKESSSKSISKSIFYSILGEKSSSKSIFYSILGKCHPLNRFHSLTCGPHPLRIFVTVDPEHVAVVSTDLCVDSHTSVSVALAMASHFQVLRSRRLRKLLVFYVLFSIHCQSSR